MLIGLAGAGAVGAPGRGSGQPIILDATQTVGLEHADRMERMRRAAAALGLDPAPQFSTTTVPARRMPSGFRVDTPVLRIAFGERTFFDTASSDLRIEAAPVLQAVAEALRGDAPDAAVFVAGHTDNRGSEPYNYALSVRRSAAVADALYGLGVGEMALWRVGFGESVPLFPNEDGPEAMGFNRRVEFLFAARAEPVLEVLVDQLDTVCVSADPRRARRCRTAIELRDNFDAVQITSRPLGVPLDAPPAPRRIPGRARPRDTIAAPAAGRRSVGAGTRMASLDAPVARRVRLNLTDRRTSIAAPIR